jgi:cytochrome c nitrite reductase small subunit
VGTSDFLNRNALKVALVVLVATAALMTFVGAGYAYSSSSGFCGTFCHSMAASNETWLASNHKQISCSECHLPQDGLVKQMVYKAQSGLNDIYVETFRSYPADITISAKSKAVLQDNCLRCHTSRLENTLLANGKEDCTRCHRNLVHSISQKRGDKS